MDVLGDPDVERKMKTMHMSKRILISDISGTYHCYDSEDIFDYLLLALLNEISIEHLQTNHIVSSYFNNNFTVSTKLMYTL